MHNAGTVAHAQKESKIMAQKQSTQAFSRDFTGAPLRRNRRWLLLSALTLALQTTGCAVNTTGNPGEPGSVGAQTKSGAMIGAAIGAVAGLFVGDGELDEVLGTAIVGAGVGAGVGNYMDRQQRELEQIEAAQVERVDDETLQVNFDSDILFGFDSARLSPGAQQDLDRFAQVVNDYDQTAVLVQGHTDSTGTEAYNLALSERRADAVSRPLRLRGVDPARLLATGYGEDYPVADNSTPEGREQNRRVSIFIRAKS